jgi:hypothetical protein
MSLAEYDPPVDELAELAKSNGSEHDPEHGSWWPIDLKPVLRGDRQRPQPTVGMRGDGRGLFYRRKSHTVVAETEAGKTWLALGTAWDEMLQGHHVIYIDWEDDEVTAVDRLRTIMPRDDLIRSGYGDELIDSHFHYLRPDSDLRRSPNALELAEVMHTFHPTLAISDGTTEAMAIHNLNPLDNVDIAVFNTILVKPLLGFDTAVVSLDHVVKDREGRGRYALGGVHKLNAVSGAGYLLENTKPFGVGLTGRSRILITKDRPGQLRTHSLPSTHGLRTYGDLVLTSHGEDSATVKIWPPKEWGDDQQERPVVFMTRIAEVLAERGEIPSKAQLEKAVTGKAETIRDALDWLILDGYVTPKPPYKLIKLYPPEEGENA